MTECGTASHNITQAKEAKNNVLRS